MKITEKMFPGSIVALLLGILLAAPLLYTNVVIEPVAAGPKPLLNVDLTYAYIEQIRGTYVPYGDFLPDSENPNATEPGTPRINYLVINNVTRLSEDIDPCDAKLLIYLVQFYSDNGFVKNLALYEGLIYNTDLLPKPPSENETSGTTFDSINLMIDSIRSGDFFGDSYGITGTGSHGQMYIGESVTQGMSGCATPKDSALEEAETMSIKISLLGWISQTGNSTDTVVLDEAEVITDVQMEKYGDGFLYNNLLPEDQLSDLDPLNPSAKLFELMGDFD